MNERLHPSTQPSRPPIWYRSIGADVVYLQELLADQGIYDIERGDPDGVFGRLTEQAVRAFQEAHQLRTDAFVGPVTWAALES